MEVFDDYILRKIHEVSPYKTFVSLMSVSKRFYNNHKDLIPIKRKESLKLVIKYKYCFKKKYYVLPNGNKEGLYEKFYQHKTLYCRSHFINNKRDGLYEKFHETGSISERCHYINDMLEGLYEKFHETGSISERCHYVNDKIEGLYEGFYESGIVSKRCYYINNKIEGLYEKFYKDAYMRCYYARNKMEGLYEELREDGSVSVRCYYANNKKHGLYESFYDDGSLKELSEYDNGTVIKYKVNLLNLSRIYPVHVKISDSVYLVDLDNNMCHRFRSITSAARILNVSKDLIEKRCNSSKIKHREYWIRERDLMSVMVNGGVKYRNVVEASIRTNISVHDIKILSKTKQSLDGYTFCMY